MLIFLTRDKGELLLILECATACNDNVGVFVVGLKIEAEEFPTVFSELKIIEVQSLLVQFDYAMHETYW